MTASFSVTMTSAVPAGQGSGLKPWWSASGRRSICRPRACSIAKNGSGRARPAAASRRRPRSAGQPLAGAAAVSVAPAEPAEPALWPAHQMASGSTLPSRRVPVSPGSAVLARPAVYSTRVCGGTCSGRAWRSGPAGRRRPLPAPRSSNTSTAMSWCRAWCCKPSSASRMSTPGWAAHSARAAAPRSAPTVTGAPLRRWINKGSSPTSAAGLCQATACTARPGRPWPREITPGVQPCWRSRASSAITAGVLPAPPATRLPTTSSGTGACCTRRRPSRNSA